MKRRDMELRTMKYFLAVAREENMTRAAELLYVTRKSCSRVTVSAYGSPRRGSCCGSGQKI